MWQISWLLKSHGGLVPELSQALKWCLRVGGLIFQLLEWALRAVGPFGEEVVAVATK